MPSHRPPRRPQRRRSRCSPRRSTRACRRSRCPSRRSTRACRRSRCSPRSSTRRHEGSRCSALRSTRPRPRCRSRPAPRRPARRRRSLGSPGRLVRHSPVPAGAASRLRRRPHLQVPPRRTARRAWRARSPRSSCDAPCRLSVCLCPFVLPPCQCRSRIRDIASPSPHSRTAQHWRGCRNCRLATPRRAREPAIPSRRPSATFRPPSAELSLAGSLSWGRTFPARRAALTGAVRVLKASASTHRSTSVQWVDGYRRTPPERAADGTRDLRRRPVRHQRSP